MKKYFSKIAALLLVVSLLATQMVPAFAVNTPAECACDAATRTGTITGTFAPTCGNYGYEVYECDECHGAYTKLTAEPTGEHDIVDYPGQPATCTEIGWEAYQTCNNCDLNTYVEIPALGHDYVGATIEPDCTNAGCTRYTCSRCGDFYDEDCVDALGHTAGDMVIGHIIPADCENGGSYEELIYCTVCREILYKNTVETPAFGHAYVEIDRKEAECQEDGYINYECTTCGGTKQEVIPCRGYHDYDKVIEGATCQSPEIVTYTCKDCGYVLVDDSGDPLPHTPADAVIENEIAADCENAGSYDSVVYCSVCGTEISRETITVEALGHNEVTDPEVYATCTEPGLTEGSHCDVCGLVFVPQDEVAPLGHSYNATVVAPTCTEEGYTLHTCFICGDSYQDTIVAIDPLSHKGVITKVGVAATCTETGLTYELACGDCGKVLATQKVIEIDPDNHDLTHVDAQAPTCTEIGWDAYEYCNRCDYTTYNELDKLGHDYEAVVTPVTCTTDGYTTHTCKVCGDVVVTDYVEATGHYDYETLGKVEPKCEEEGYTVKKCLICETVFRDEYVDALGHDLTQYEALDPTCTEIGWNAYEDCARCDYTTYEEKAALGHRLERWLEKAPTCTEAGYTDHLECAFCDYTTLYFEIAPTGHNLIQVEAKDPDCTNIGWDAYEYCDKCDYTTYVEKAAIGHRLERWLEKPATCTEAGYTEHLECAFCDYTTLYFDIAPLGHKVVVDAAVPATFDETGLTEGSHCGTCGEVLVAQEIVPVLNEVISFSYEAIGINGSDNAVNSGYVYVNVYMNVESDIARIWGLNLDLAFNENLTLVSVSDMTIFEQNLYTNIDQANDTNVVMISQDMGFSGDKTVEKGTYLFATLTFKVAKDFFLTDAGVEVIAANCDIARRGEYVNEQFADFGTGAMIHVDMLGDANGDGNINSTDSMLMSQWFADADLDAYDTIYDMNKDGFIDGDDFALLRGAIVRDNSYLDM